MKMSKKMMVGLILATGVTGVASAHNQTGGLGTAASGNAATDVYVVNCYDDGSGAAAKLSLRVADLAPVLAPLISIQATTNVNTGAGFSPEVTLVGGAGNYILNISKAASTVKGMDTYNAMFHCQTATGVHTGTTWTMTQNQ
jgi:hypothetical protein